MVHPFILTRRINLQMSQPVVFATLSGRPPIFANTRLNIPLLWQICKFLRHIKFGMHEGVKTARNEIEAAPLSGCRLYCCVCYQPFITFSQKRWRRAAIWARVALPADGILSLTYLLCCFIMASESTDSRDAGNCTRALLVSVWALFSLPILASLNKVSIWWIQ